MNKIIKLNNIVASILIVFFSFSNVFAAYENSNIDLGEYRIHYNKNECRYIKYNGTSQRFFDYYYIDNENNRYPAYCIDLGMDGAEKGEYTVNINEKIGDKKLSNIILNGFPNKQAGELGLITDEEAKFATQFAVWVYTGRLDMSKIQALNSDNQRVVDAIKKIYNNGVNGNILNNTVNVIPIDEEFKIDEMDNSYYSRRYRLDFDRSMVLDIRPFNENSIIKMADVNNQILGKYLEEKEIKLLIPRDKILEDTKIKFDILCNVKQDAVMFGKTTDATKQNAALALKPEKEEIVSLDLDIKYTPTILKIIKVDKENNKIRIPNTKFKIYSKNKEKELGEYTTDLNGEINIDLQKEFNCILEEDIVIEEIESNEEYYLDKDNNEYILKVKPGEENEIYIGNQRIYGKIQIIKTSNNDNKLSKLSKGSKLKDTVFNILDVNGNIVDTITTNEDGKAISKDLPKGKYYIKEIKASKYYVLNSNIYEVHIKENNEIVRINIGNDNIEYMEKLPYTGM